MSGKRAKLIRKAVRQFLRPRTRKMNDADRRKLFYRTYRWAKRDYVASSH